MIDPHPHDVLDDSKVIHFRDTVNATWSLAEARTQALLKLSMAPATVTHAVLSVYMPGSDALKPIWLDRDESDTAICGLVLGMGLAKEARRMPSPK